MGVGVCCYLPLLGYSRFCRRGSPKLSLPQVRGGYPKSAHVQIIVVFVPNRLFTEQLFRSATLLLG